MLIQLFLGTLLLNTADARPSPLTSNDGLNGGASHMWVKTNKHHVRLYECYAINEEVDPTEPPECPYIEVDPPSTWDSIGLGEEGGFDIAVSCIHHNQEDNQDFYKNAADGRYVKVEDVYIPNWDNLMQEERDHIDNIPECLVEVLYQLSGAPENVLARGPPGACLPQHAPLYPEVIPEGSILEWVSLDYPDRDVTTFCQPFFDTECTDRWARDGIEESIHMSTFKITGDPSEPGTVFPHSLQPLIKGFKCY